MTLFLLSLGSFLAKISRKLGKFGAYVAAFGGPGLFVICLLDSSFVPLPSVADALLIALSTSNPHWMPMYVFLAVAGSTVGCLMLYFVSRKAGGRALSKFPEAKQKRVKDWIDKYDFLSVLVASVLPPPFPLKLFVVTTGVMRLSVIRFALAIAAGRAFRYLLLGYLAAKYGEHAKEILGKYYPWIGLGVAIAVVLFFVTKSLLKRKPAPVEI
ncbi:MAG TPA: VTT domain-containing protein [Pyrinomonadaceae bacterium]|nr:VTT domain-containing protein [Pyrinomonadaceae bacterium]